MARALRVAIAAIAWIGLSACTGDERQPGADTGSTFTPAGVQATVGVVLVTGESVPPEANEFEAGVGVGGQIKLGPAGCLSMGMDEEARSSRLLVFPAGSNLVERQDGEVVVRVGRETFAIGDAFEGGRSISAPDGQLEDIYPQLVTDVPEPCRKMNVFTVDAPMSHPEPPGGPVIALPETWDAYPYAAFPEARLRIRQGCLLVDGRVSIWPYGTYFDRELREVVTDDGRRLSLTESVRLGGGSYEADTDFASWLGSDVGDRIKTCFERTGAPAARVVFAPK